MSARRLAQLIYAFFWVLGALFICLLVACELEAQYVPYSRVCVPTALMGVYDTWPCKETALVAGKETPWPIRNVPTTVTASNAPAPAAVRTVLVTRAASATVAAKASTAQPSLSADDVCFVDCICLDFVDAQRFAQAQLDAIACRTWPDCRWRPFGDAPGPGPGPQPSGAPYNTPFNLPTKPPAELRGMGFVTGDRIVTRFIAGEGFKWQVIRAGAAIPGGWNDGGIIQ